MIRFNQLSFLALLGHLNVALSFFFSEKWPKGEAGVNLMIKDSLWKQNACYIDKCRKNYLYSLNFKTLCVSFIFECILSSRNIQMFENDYSFTSFISPEQVILRKETKCGINIIVWYFDVFFVDIIIRKQKF